MHKGELLGILEISTRNFRRIKLSHQLAAFQTPYWIRENEIIYAILRENWEVNLMHGMLKFPMDDLENLSVKRLKQMMDSKGISYRGKLYFIKCENHILKVTDSKFH